MEIQKASKFNGFQTKKGNYVWGGALGLSWYQLIDKFVKEPIKINSKDQLALDIVNNFNKCKFSTKDIDDRCIYIKSGYGQDTVTKINTECKKKFPEKSFGDLDIVLGPQDIISYAYLLKKLQFKVKFTKESERKFLFEGKQVQSFYAKDKKQKQQIHWHYYKNQNHFMISIEAKKPSDKIYFIKDKNIQTLDEAIQKVVGSNNYASKLSQIDCFQMPLVELDLRRDVKQLIGIKLANNQFKDYIFSVVYEAIKLKIDQAGAKVQNQGVIMMLKAKCVKKQVIQPKYFILDKQFWVIMKQEGKHPYFGALIKNPKDC